MHIFIKVENIPHLHERLAPKPKNQLGFPQQLLVFWILVLLQNPGTFQLDRQLDIIFQKILVEWLNLAHQFFQILKPQNNPRPSNYYHHALKLCVFSTFTRYNWTHNLRKFQHLSYQSTENFPKSSVKKDDKQ